MERGKKMLTEKELQWLDNRGKFSCWYCPDIPQAMCTMGERPAHCAIMDTDYKDAADFSERVAMKLAQVAAMQKKHHCCVDIDVPFHCPGWQSCAERMMSRKELRPCEFEMLKGARIEVEEEMDGEAK